MTSSELHNLFALFADFICHPSKETRFDLILEINSLTFESLEGIATP